MKLLLFVAVVFSVLVALDYGLLPTGSADVPVDAHLPIVKIVGIIAMLVACTGASFLPRRLRHFKQPIVKVCLPVLSLLLIFLGSPLLGVPAVGVAVLGELVWGAAFLWVCITCDALDLFSEDAVIGGIFLASALIYGFAAQWHGEPSMHIATAFGAYAAFSAFSGIRLTGHAT